MRVAAVIVTYNRKEKLANCIDAVLAQTSDAAADIIVVDNGSSDGTDEMLRSRFGDMITEEDDAAGLSESAEAVPPEAGGKGGRILYYDLRFNSGGAGGFCFGVRRAVEKGYDFLWLMDDDSVPSESALGEFLSFEGSHHGEYGFLSGKALWRDGSLCRMNVQRETVLRNVTDWDRSVISIAMASFVSLFIPAPVVAEVGLPVRDFFIWTDDWEYTRRISMKHPCYLISGSTVIHDMDENTKSDIALASADRLDRFRYRYRNEVYLYRREGLKGICFEAAKTALHLFKIAKGRGSIAEKKKKAGIVLGGTIEGLSFFPVPERLCPQILPAEPCHGPERESEKE